MIRNTLSHSPRIAPLGASPRRRRRRFGGDKGMADIAGDHDKEAQRSARSGYRFDFITFGLLAIAVVLAAVAIALRHL
jgi:hypothetical protein